MSEYNDIKALLFNALEKLSLDFVCDDLFDYLLLLNKWNQAYNLTAVRDLQAMVYRHLIDSLSILPWIKGRRLLDVGTGAGFPGIPLALVNTDLQVVLLDSNGKKTRFLQEVKRVLKLNHVEIVQSRVESYHPSLGFDTVTSRAFSDVGVMLSCTQHLIKPEGIWLLMKGRSPTIEMTNINKPYHIESYAVAGIEGDRCCVIIENKD